MNMPPSPFLLGLKNLGQFLGKKLDALTASVDALRPSKTGDDSTRQLSVALMRFEAAIQKIKEPKFSGEVKVDGSGFTREIKAIAAEIKDLSKGLKPTDTSKLEREMASLVRALENQPWDKVVASLASVKTAIEASALNTKKALPVKLDEMQLRQLGRAGGGVAVMRGGGGERLLARNVRNSQIAMTSANHEYSYTFPSNSLMWRMKIRAQDSGFFYSWTASTLPGSGDGSAYLSVPANFLDSREGVDFSGKTIYFESDVAANVMEIEVYTA